MNVKLLYNKNYCNDIWMVSFVNDGVLINDGYDGLCVISEDLQEIRKKIKFKECILLREKYMKDNGKEILLYLDDDAGFIYVNLESSKIIYINMPEEIKDIALSDIFNWVDDKIYIKDYRCGCCTVDVNSKNITYNIIDNLLEKKLCNTPKLPSDILSNDMKREYHNDYFFNGVWVMMSEKIMDIVADNTKYRLISMGEFIGVDVKKMNDNYYVAILDDIYGNKSYYRTISIYRM